MHPKRVVITRVSAVVVTAIVGVIAAVRTFGSLLPGHLFKIVKVVVLPSDGRLRARATVIRVVTPPIIFWLVRHFLVILPLHAPDVL
jgi:hypothetical protein